MVWELWSLYLPGPLHFQGNLFVLANLDFHQCQENPKEKTYVLKVVISVLTGTC